MKHTIESARIALSAYMTNGTMTPGGSFNDYDCDGIRVATFKVDGGLNVDGDKYAGVKRQYPGQPGTASRRHLTKYTR